MREKPMKTQIEGICLLEVQKIEKVENNYCKYLMSEEYSDLVIIVGEEKIKTHKIIFLNDCNEKKMEELMNISEITSNSKIEDIHTVLNYLYGGDLVVDYSNIKNIILVLEEFGLEKVQVLCYEYLISLFDKDTAILILNKAINKEFEFNPDPFIKSILEYIIQNITLILNSTSFKYLKQKELEIILKSEKLFVDEKVLFHKVLDWIEMNEDEDKEKLKRVLAYIKFNIFDEKILTDEFKKKYQKYLPLNYFSKLDSFKKGSLFHKFSFRSYYFQGSTLMSPEQMNAVHKFIGILFINNQG
jgi:hypothetical protein